MAVNANILAGAAEGTGLNDLTKGGQQRGKEKEDGDVHIDSVFEKLVILERSKKNVLCRS